MSDIAESLDSFDESVERLFAITRIGEILNFDISDSDEWDSFKESWNDLKLDEYMNDNGTYRKRRFCKARYIADEDSLWMKEYDFYHQPQHINPLNGGMKRWFAQVESHTFSNRVLNGLLKKMGKRLTSITGQDVWDINIYQNRIVAKDGEAGKPSPEGIHKDGVKHTVLLLINRENVEGGENTIYDLSKTPLFSHTLTQEGDCLIFCDDPTFHYASPVKQISESQTGYRDMLVVEFY